jgi:xanthine dehydrogenase iron-sulfur cluster and FAD-binding subunit A
MAREYEQSQFIALLQTLGPNTPVLPLILKGVIQNSSLSNRAEMIEALDKMAQPDPQAQAMQQQQQMLALEAQKATIAVNTTQAERNKAEAMNTMVEAQLKPQEVQAKIIASSTQNLPNNDQLASQEFDRRVKIAELQLKEADIKNKSKIVEMQMSESRNKMGGMEEDFLSKLQEKLNNGH